MDLVGTAVGNPLNEDDLKEDSDAVLAPDLLLVRVYGGKLMQLGAFMPPLLVFISLMKAAVRAVVDSWANSSFCTYNNVTIGGIMAGA